MSEQQKIPTSEILNKAADYIETEGWLSGACGMEADTPGLCIEGAIGAAIGASTFGFGERQVYAYDEVEECPAALAVSVHLETSGNLYDWNDAKGRTAEEVIEVLRATAVIEAARESELAQVSA